MQVGAQVVITMGPFQGRSGRITSVSATGSTMLFTVDTLPNVAFVKECLRWSVTPSLQSAVTSPSLAGIIPRRTVEPSQAAEEASMVEDPSEVATFKVSMLGGQTAEFLARVAGPSVASVNVLKQQARKAFDMATDQPVQLVYNDKAMEPDMELVSSFGIAEVGGTFALTVVKKSALRVAMHKYFNDIDQQDSGRSTWKIPLESTKELFLEIGKPLNEQLGFSIHGHDLFAVPAGTVPPPEGTHKECTIPGARQISHFYLDGSLLPEDLFSDGEGLVVLPCYLATLLYPEIESPSCYERTADGFVDRWSARQFS